MNDEPVEDDVLAFVERFGDLFSDAGMPRMAARVFACLLVSDSGALEAAQIAESLRISPAAVSGAVRYLTQVDMITRERPTGSRRDVYRLYNDTWYEMFAHRDQLLLRWAASLQSGVEVLGAESAAGARLSESVDFFQYLATELPLLLERWRGTREGSGL